MKSLDIIMLENEIAAQKRRIADLEYMVSFHRKNFLDAYRMARRIAKWRDLCLDEIDDWKRIAREAVKR